MKTATTVTTIAGLCFAAVTVAKGQQPVAPHDTGPVVATPAMVALGDSIFHGKVAGGTCFACHGADAKGVPGLAPDLTAGKWLHGDGSYAFIIETVKAGVPKPKQSAAPMPPMGGVKLGDAEIHAVAAYVYSLTHVVGRSNRN